MKNWDDLTIDTNVLMHCDNPNEDRFDDARAFIEAFLESETALCVDEGFSLDEAQNRSHIGQEHLEHLVPGNLGYQAIVKVAQTTRVKLTKKKMSLRDIQQLNRLVHDKTDRPFVRVAKNSGSRVLVSHDFLCFSETVRREVRRELGVQVVCASET